MNKIKRNGDGMRPKLICDCTYKIVEFLFIAEYFRPCAKKTFKFCWNAAFKLFALLISLAVIHMFPPCLWKLHPASFPPTDLAVKYCHALQTIWASPWKRKWLNFWIVYQMTCTFLRLRISVSILSVMLVTKISVVISTQRIWRRTFLKRPW